MVENLGFLLDVGEVKGRDCEKEEDSKKEKEQEREVA